MATAVVGGSAIVVAVLVAGVALRRPESGAERPHLAALVTAASGRRSVEGRLTGGFPWEPYATPTRAGAGASASPRDWGARASLLAAADAVRKRALAAPDDAQALADLGAAHLLTGAPDKAAEVLEEARDRRPSDASILNDLATAYLARGQARDIASDTARALDAAERSARAEPSRLEAWFNRAIALERLRLDEAARGAWQDYLRRDAASPWAGEARARLAQLESHPTLVSASDLETALTGDLPSGTVARLELSLSPVRAFIDNELLPRWATAIVEGKGAVSDTRIVEAANRLTSQVARIGKDPQLADVAAAMTAASRLSAANRLEFARGILARHDARVALEQSNVGRALAPLERARKTLTSHEALALDVELYRLIALVQKGVREEAVPDLASLERRSAARGYRYLAARASLVRGLIHFRLANFADALAAYERAVSGFREARENAFLAAALSYRSEALSAVGDREQAWSTQIDAFGLLDVVPDHPRRHGVLTPGGLLPLQEGLAGAAVHVQLASLENARRWNVAGSHVAARLQLARSLAALNQQSDAGSVLAEAKTWVGRIPDPSLRGQYAIELALAEGDVAAAARDAAGATTAYTDAISGLAAIKSWYRLSPIYLKRGFAHALRDDWPAAERDWLEGVRLVEEQRRTVRNDTQRISHLEQVWDLYAALIEHEALRRGNAESALRLVERGRARVLLESMTGVVPVNRLSTAAADERPFAPKGTTAVVYMALEKKLLIWVVSDQATRMTAVDVTRVTLERLVSGFRERLGEAGEAADLGRRLYALIWAPIAPQVQGISSLVIVPDGPLAPLPFAALDDGGSYLIERHALSRAPSLATLRIATQQNRKARDRDAQGRTLRDAAVRHALIAADPAIDRTRHPRLPALQAARQEAADVASLYEHPVVLRGADVTKPRLIAELARADFLHFAGHAISNDVNPDQAYLVVAPSGDGAGAARFEVGEIAGLRLDDLRFVVLSACQTGTGRVARGEGTLSLARPFLVAGVPTVIATLWLVDDVLARDMMREMHQRLRAGDAPDVALQRVQLAYLRDARTVASSRRSTSPTTLAWADFVVIGAAHAIHE